MKVRILKYKEIIAFRVTRQFFQIPPPAMDMMNVQKKMRSVGKNCLLPRIFFSSSLSHFSISSSDMF